MKKIMLSLVLLLVCFFHINVMADEPGTTETKKEPGDSCLITIVFREESNTGEVINSGNGVNQNTTQTISSGGSGSKTTRALQKTTFGSGPKYTVDGWYDENGNPVPESMYYNASTPTRIRVRYACSKTEPEDMTITYILKWNAEKANKYKLIVHDEVSTSGGSWGNEDGHFGTYSHTFKEPEQKSHYQFVYYKLGEKTFQAGQTYDHDVTNQEVEELVEDAYAYWKADVTLNLYDGTKLLSTQSDFTSVSINTQPEKIGYEFLGWKDSNGNEVTETTFYPEAMGTNPSPKQVNLYANWKQIKMDLDVTKVWEDEDNLEGFRPDEITIELLGDGQKVAEATIKGEGNKWTYTFKDLVKFNTEKEIVYTIREVKQDNYETNIDGLTITNHRDVEKVDLEVKKEWDDANNQDGIRPKEVVYTLSNGEKITLNDANNWQGSIKGLVKYNNGKEIEYNWTEATVEGYKLTNVSVNDYTTIFTNTHTPEVTKVIVNKVWADDDNASGKRPQSINITLLANDKEIKTIELTSASEWKHTFDELPVYANGNKITYSVLEKEAPEGYEVSYEGDMKEGFTIHNVLGQGDGEPEEVVTPSEPKTNNPQTSDNIVMYLMMLLISTIGIVIGKIYIKKFN